MASFTELRRGRLCSENIQKFKFFELGEFTFHLFIKRHITVIQGFMVIVWKQISLILGLLLCFHYTLIDRAGFSG